MLKLDEDRRVHPRIALQRPCKIYDPRSGKYFPATTSDLSAGGMMILIDRDLSLQLGDILHIGVAQKRRQMLLRTDEMLRMRVARCMGSPSGEWMIGLEMLSPVPVEDTLLRHAA